MINRQSDWALERPPLTDEQVIAIEASLTEAKNSTHPFRSELGERKLAQFLAEQLLETKRRERAA